MVLVLRTFLLITLVIIPALNHEDVFAQGADIDSVIEQEMHSGGLVGLAAAVIINGEIAWSEGYGYADLENQVQFTPKTLMNIASITKTITASCLMILVEKKYLFLDFYVNEIIPFEIPDREFTLRQLATHTSGIVDRSDFYSENAYIYHGETREPLGVFLMNYLTKKGKYFSNENFNEFEPGSYFQHSNIGAALAGYLVECISGITLDKFSRQYLFDPLDMKSTGWFMADIDRSKHAKLYRKGGSETIPFYELATYPDKNVRTSVSELSNFLICITGGGEFNETRIFEESTIEEMLAPQFNKNNFPANFNDSSGNLGIFWGIHANEKGETIIGHAGSDPGVQTLMHYNVDRKTGIIVFTNTDDDESTRNSFKRISEHVWNFSETLR